MVEEAVGTGKDQRKLLISTSQGYLTLTVREQTVQCSFLPRPHSRAHVEKNLSESPTRPRASLERAFCSPWSWYWGLEGAAQPKRSSPLRVPPCAPLPPISLCPSPPYFTLLFCLGFSRDPTTSLHSVSDPNLPNLAFCFITHSERVPPFLRSPSTRTNTEHSHNIVPPTQCGTNVEARRAGLGLNFGHSIRRERATALKHPRIMTPAATTQL
jgi:hypothetical protein